MKRLTGILIFKLILLSQLFAQQYNFTTWSIDDGLSQSVVNCIFQDSRGYIWMGTQNGLDRFDGENFILYRYDPTDSGSISNNWIYSISEDKEGNLWIGTKGGLQKYLRTENSFKEIRYQADYEYHLTTYSYDNICLQNGNILINTPPVISIYNPGTQEIIHYTTRFAYDSSVKDVKIPVLEDKNGNIWMGNPNGLALFDIETKQFSYYSFVNSRGETFSEASVTALSQDKSGTVWAGTVSGLFAYNPVSNYFEEARFNSETESPFIFEVCIRNIVEDKKGSLIIATEGNGLYIISPSSESEYSIRNFTLENSQIGHNIVQSLLIDKSENLWVGTLSGVSKTDLKKKKFKLYRNTYRPDATNLLGNVIAGMFKNDDGIIWVGNWGQGLNLVNHETNTVEHFSSQHTGNHYLPNDFVHVIFKDSGGTIWLGTRNGIFIYNKPDNRFQLWNNYFNKPNLPTFENIRVYQIIQDREHNYWIGTSNGLYKVNMENSSVEVFHTDEDINHRLSANLVYSVMEDSWGMIWIATINGLDVYNPATKEIKHFTKENNGLASNFIISLCEDNEGKIWIGSNAYINIYNPKDSVFSYMGKEHGLPSNYIYEIKKDKNNNLWFATGNGLSMLDINTNEIENFNSEDGLQSREFNLRAAYVCANGEMLFGGMNGFNVFHPDSIAGNPFKPELVFTSFTKTTDEVLESVNLELAEKVVLTHKVQSFTIEFAALEFTNPQKNNYAYKMEGVTDEWEEIGNRKFVPFFALPPGEYTFWVKGSNNDGQWNNHAININLVILTPWWRSSYAYLAYLFIIVFGIVSFIKIRERRLKHDKLILEQKVTERTLQIEEQNKVITAKNVELNELNRTKDKFFSIIGHDLGNHFNIIIGFSEVLLSGFRKMDSEKQEYHISNIYKSSVQAHDLLGNLLTWARLQRKAIVYKPEKVNVAAKIRELISFHEEAAMKKNILIEVLSGQEICIYADVNMFSTIIRN
ncbi:MAG: two-component regulator propeller domain-containing protein, partial [Bacteroidota bacterium]